MSETTAPTVLDGRYRLLAQLAVGGTSTVHLAEDTVLNRTVAVKVLHPHLSADEAVVDRFQREAHAAAQLSHPHVVTMFDVSRDGTYLVMEHVDGPSLRDVLRLRGRLRPEQALSILAPVAAGLSAAHAAGLVHRDVKPENVLMGEDGRVRVGDFGLARSAASASTTFGPDVFAGSPSYTSPEAVRGDVLDARSDVYALGVMLYECLTGRAPFRADSPFATAMMHTTHRVPAPSDAVDGLPPAIDAVVQRATAPDPTDRYEDAAAFARALEAAVPDGPAPVDLRDGGSQTVVIPVDASETVVTTRSPERSRWRRFGAALRRRWLVVTVVLLLLAAAGGWLTYDQVLAPVTDIPDGLVGAEEAAAEARLTGAGFAVAVDDDTRFTTEIPAGHVVEVAPDDQARRGTEVVLVLSAGPRQVEVPQVVGEPEARAVAELESRDFRVKVERAFNEQVEQGRVISAKPRPGREVDEGSRITIAVSKGRQPIEVPSVVGVAADAARAQLDEAGLVGDVVGSAHSDEVPAGAIVAQSISPGETRHRGDVVELTVSDGPRPFKLPNVREMPEDEAVSQLEGLGLQVEVRYVNALFGIGAGRVGQQSPSAGTMVVKGDTVRLTVLR